MALLGDNGVGIVDADEQPERGPSLEAELVRVALDSGHGHRGVPLRCCLEDLAMLHIFLTCLMGVVIADLVGRMLLATGTVAEP